MPSPRRAGIICAAALVAGAACSWGKGSGAHQTTNEEARELVAAVTSGDVMRVESLLSSGVNPNVRSKRQGDYLGPPSLPALDVAIGRGNQQMVQILLEHGANPNSVSSTDILLDPTFTPLTRAINKGLADIAAEWQRMPAQLYITGLGQNNCHSGTRMREAMRIICRGSIVLMVSIARAGAGKVFATTQRARLSDEIFIISDVLCRAGAVRVSAQAIKSPQR